MNRLRDGNDLCSCSFHLFGTGMLYSLHFLYSFYASCFISTTFTASALCNRLVINYPHNTYTTSRPKSEWLNASSFPGRLTVCTDQFYGTLGKHFSPGVQKESTLKFFQPDFCRWEICYRHKHNLQSLHTFRNSITTHTHVFVTLYFHCLIHHLIQRIEVYVLILMSFQGWMFCWPNSVKGKRYKLYHFIVSVAFLLFNYRPTLLTFKDESSVWGIKTLRFSLVSEVAMTCQCVTREGGNLIRLSCPDTKGISDASSCMEGPFTLSSAHFLFADDSLKEQVLGLKPDASKHETYLDIEPVRVDSSSFTYFRNFDLWCDVIHERHLTFNLLVIFVFLSSSLTLDISVFIIRQSPLIHTLWWPGNNISNILSPSPCLVGWEKKLTGTVLQSVNRYQVNFVLKRYPRIEWVFSLHLPLSRLKVGEVTWETCTLTL